MWKQTKQECSRRRGIAWGGVDDPEPAKERRCEPNPPKLRVAPHVVAVVVWRARTAAAAQLGEATRNEALLLCETLTRSNGEVRKFVAFNEGFEKLFEIMRREGAFDDAATRRRKSAAAAADAGESDAESEAGDGASDAGGGAGGGGRGVIVRDCLAVVRNVVRGGGAAADTGAAAEVDVTRNLFAQARRRVARARKFGARPARRRAPPACCS